MLGILRQSQAVFYALAFFQLDGFAPAQRFATHAVGCHFQGDIMKINKVASLILIFFLLGCNSISQPTSTQTESIPSFTPTLVNTPIRPELTPTSTPAPSKIEKLTHAFAYGEENNILIVDENGKKVEIVKTEIGWIKDFKFSADNAKVIFSIIDKKNSDSAYYGYGLHLQMVGSSASTEILSQNIRVVFFEWLNSEEVIIVTLKDTFVLSTDGTKTKIEQHPSFFTNANRSHINYLKSPNLKSALILQQTFDTDGQAKGCGIYFVDFEKIHTVEILKSENCDGIFKKNWSSDGKVISIQYREEVNNSWWFPALLFDVGSEEITVSDQSTLLNIPTWSPDGQFYSSNKFNSFFVRMSDSQNEENYYQHSSSIFTDVINWSPNSQYFIYRDGGNYFIFNIKDKTEKRINFPDLKFNLDLNEDKYWWLPDSSGVYFTATDSNHKTAIYFLPLNSKKYQLVGDVLDFPIGDNYFFHGYISSSPDNKYSAVHYNTNESSFYLLIDNQTKLSTSLF